MYNKNRNNIGDEIREAVQNAVNSMDFRQINKDIQNTVNGAIDEVRRSIGIHQGYHMDPNRPNEHEAKQNNFQDTYKQTPKRYVPNNQVLKYTVPVGRVSGILLTVFGIIGSSALGIAIFVLAILGYALQNYTVFGPIITGLSPLFLLSIIATMSGSSVRKRLKRFRQYVALFGEHNYCSIKVISSHTGENPKHIVKELRKMIALGMFPQGHIDEEKTCFMLNNESYQEYLKLQQGIRMRQIEEENQRTMESTTQASQESTSISPECAKAIAAGKSCIQKIKEANDAIPGEEISRKLDRLETVTDKIFKYIELHPEQFSEIQKFMEYYLPTTLKLVDAYVEFDKQPVQGDNISSAKKEIEDTLDTINLAFEKLLDSLFEETAMDVSTDISVLHTLLAQEGLTTRKDFQKQ